MGAEEKVRGRQIRQGEDGDCGPVRRRGRGHHIDRDYNSPVHWAENWLSDNSYSLMSL